MNIKLQARTNVKYGPRVSYIYVRERYKKNFFTDEIEWA